MTKLFAPFMLAIAAASASAGGTSQATNADLQAAYCFASVKQEAAAITVTYNDWPAPRAPEIESLYRDAMVKFNKLRNFLLARTSALEPGGVNEVMAATKAGEEALTVSGQIIRTCAEKVGNALDQSSQVTKIMACVNEHDGYKTLRLDRCKSLSFLPY